MFGARARQIGTERRIEELERLVRALTESAARASAEQATRHEDAARTSEERDGRVGELARSLGVLSEQNARLRVIVESNARETTQLRDRCMKLQDQLSAMTDRFEGDSAHWLSVEALRLSLKALSDRVDWVDDNAQKAAIALLEQVRLLQDPPMPPKLSIRQ